jgi:hypothetical protein
MKNLIGTAAIAAALVLPVGASADALSYAKPSADRTVQGVISSINGKYGLTVHDDRGFLDNVTMHQGTVINPSGLRLAPGMRVTIAGYTNRATFDANRIAGPVDAQNTLVRSTNGRTPSLIPEAIPNGTFQTTGPSAVGGG